MPRSHGWSGATPASDEEAVKRILDAAEAMLEEEAALRFAELARTLGVTRQTIYRYFPSADAVRVALAMRSTDGLLRKMSRRLAGLTDPVVAITEAILLARRELAGDPVARGVLARHDHAGFGVSSSDAAMAFSHAMLNELDIDWDAYGYEDADLDELAEVSMRMLLSLLTDPGNPPRSETETRRFLTRWLGPGVLYPTLMRPAASLTGIRLDGAAPKRARTAGVRSPSGR